jgi:hypothetical protein
MNLLMTCGSNINKLLLISNISVCYQCEVGFIHELLSSYSQRRLEHITV